MLSVIAAQNRNSPAQVVQKCARRLIDGTQCFHCDRLENVMSLLLLLLFLFFYFFMFLIIPSAVKIPRVKSSKKLKSKAGVVMHLNRPAGTPGQQQSHKIAQSWSVEWWLRHLTTLIIIIIIIIIVCLV